MEKPTLSDIQPSGALWYPDEEIPGEIAAIMPDESSIPDLASILFGGLEPADTDLVRGVVNYRRQQIWAKYLAGFYAAHPEYLQR